MSSGSSPWPAGSSSLVTCPDLARARVTLMKRTSTSFDLPGDHPKHSQEGATTFGSSTPRKLCDRRFQSCWRYWLVVSRWLGRLPKMHLQRPPNCVYLGNENARTLRTSDAIAEDLASNVAHGVRWYDPVTVLDEMGCHLFLEMPPGHTLTQLATETVPSVQALALGETSHEHALDVIARYLKPQ